jgi:probable HAF family extracellular repeat protein
MRTITVHSRKWIQITLVCGLAAFAGGTPLAAQGQGGPQAQDQKHHRYRFVDIGTLGGPASYYSAEYAGSLILNARGAVAGYGDTPFPDPYAPNCWDQDCYLAHAFRWQKGVLNDLGALPGTNNSAITGINARGWIAGFSQNGLFDPLLGTPAFVPTLWKRNQILNLGTLGGYEGVAVYVNDAGQVVGFSTIDGNPDPFSPFGASVHAYIWANGEMRDLGTLGGPDSFPGPGGINQRNGLVVGSSYLDSTPNPTTGVPTTHPFLWEDGKMIDLGTLGGTNCCYTIVANNRRQVAGNSNMPGDLTSHPFFWDRGVITDIGTLGGSNGQVSWINDAGEVVGEADLPGDQQHDAFFWKDGVMSDLGNLGQTSFAFCVNSRHQVVGSSLTNDGSYHAFLSEPEGSMIDLNALVSPGSNLVLGYAFNINDEGEIAGLALPPGCTNDACGRLFILIPCHSDQGDGAPCAEDDIAAQTSVSRVIYSGQAQPAATPPGRIGSRFAKLRKP